MFEDKTAKQTEQLLKTDMRAGLSGEEARERYSREGPNQLAAAKRKSPLACFLEQLNDPLIYVLLAAAAISMLLREVSDAVIIIAVVGLNAAVGMVQEGKAQKALDSLKKLTQPTAVVIRDGRVDAAGTHRELLARGGLYSQMWEAHMSVKDRAAEKEEGGELHD